MEQRLQQFLHISPLLVRQRSSCRSQNDRMLQQVLLPQRTTDNSEFDQYGDTEAFGVFPDWQRQLSRFASVQDRLREWNPEVGDKIKHFTCLVISMLDIDGFRIDKAAQLTTDYLASWGKATHDCARQYGKNNFYIPGEITGGDT